VRSRVAIAARTDEVGFVLEIRGQRRVNSECLSFRQWTVSPREVRVPGDRGRRHPAGEHTRAGRRRGRVAHHYLPQVNQAGQGQAMAVPAPAAVVLDTAWVDGRNSPAKHYRHRGGAGRCTAVAVAGRCSCHRHVVLVACRRVVLRPPRVVAVSGCVHSPGPCRPHPLVGPDEGYPDGARGAAHRLNLGDKFARRGRLGGLGRGRTEKRVRVRDRDHSARQREEEDGRRHSARPKLVHTLRLWRRSILHGRLFKGRQR
jgi:hypothetical protein